MNPTYKKWIVRPLVILIISVGGLATVAFLILTTQQERLVNLAVGELNKQFKGELTVSESQISLFKNFPYVSVALHNVSFFPDKTKTGKAISEIDRLYVG